MGFNPDQPRDKQGEWSSGGGKAQKAQGNSASRPTGDLHASPAKVMNAAKSAMSVHFGGDNSYKNTILRKNTMSADPEAVHQGLLKAGFQPIHSTSGTDRRYADDPQTHTTTYAHPDHGGSTLTVTRSLNGIHEFSARAISSRFIGRE